MRRQLIGVLLLVAAFVLVPAVESLAQGKKKDGEWDKKSGGIDSATLSPQDYTGKLVSVPGTDRLFVVEIESKNVVVTGISGGGLRTPPRAKTKSVSSKHQVEFQLAEKAKIRSMLLPEQFDDKGNLKKYSNAELARLKGKDPRQPGYEASLDQLQAGQTVLVTLAPAPKRSPKSKDADGLKSEKKLQVTRLVILSEATGPTPAPKGKKK